MHLTASILTMLVCTTLAANGLTTLTSLTSSLAKTYTLTVPTATPINCASYLTRLVSAIPQPIAHPAFAAYMQQHDPFVKGCKSAGVPGISLLERNGFVEDYRMAATWVNALHAKLEAVTRECRLLATQQFSTSKNDLAAWKTAGLLKGIPETWDALDKQLRPCGQETGKGKASQDVTSSAAAKKVLFLTPWGQKCESWSCVLEGWAFGLMHGFAIGAMAMTSR